MFFWVLFLRQEMYLARRGETRQSRRINRCGNKREARSDKPPSQPPPWQGEEKKMLGRVSAILPVEPLRN